MSEDLVADRTAQWEAQRPTPSNDFMVELIAKAGEQMRAARRIIIKEHESKEGLVAPPSDRL